MRIIFPLPRLGLHKGYASSEQPPATSSGMKNVRPYDVYEKRLRLGQRPGVRKQFQQRMSSADAYGSGYYGSGYYGYHAGASISPIVAVAQVTTVEMS